MTVVVDEGVAAEAEEKSLRAMTVARAPAAAEMIGMVVEQHPPLTPTAEAPAWAAARAKAIFIVSCLC